MRYIQSFQNDAAIQGAVDSNLLGHPYVALDDELHKIDWDSKGGGPDYLHMPLTIEMLEDGTLHFEDDRTSWNYTRGPRWYSLNGGELIELNVSSMSLLSGDKVQLYGRGLTSNPADGPNGRCFRIRASGKHNVYGNVFSLLYDLIDYSTLRDFSWVPSGFGDGSYAVYGLFSGDTQLVSAENLMLPATALTASCYRCMLQANPNADVNMVGVPQLPATILADSCYKYMFQGRKGITTPPALPATTLAASCYAQMFLGCTSLTKSPELAVTTVPGSGETGAYYAMFSGCTSLAEVTCYAKIKVNVPAKRPTRYWLAQVPHGSTASPRKFYTKSDCIWATNSVDGIPGGWTRVNV